MLKIFIFKCTLSLLLCLYPAKYYLQRSWELLEDKGNKYLKDKSSLAKKPLITAIRQESPYVKMRAVA